VIDRREFLKTLAKLGVGAAAAPALCKAFDYAYGGRGMPRPYARARPWPAEYATANSDQSVTCELCPHHERLSPGQTGFCRARTNINGKLVTHASGQPCVLNMDPIEKNPMNHVLPGRKVLTIAHAGCNMRCAYCQNWQFSQQSPTETRNISFNQDESLEVAKGRSVPAVTFTYTEGTSHIEFNKRFAKRARELGFRVFLCTNGYINAKPLDDFLKVLDGVTVTIKGFSDRFYRDVTAARNFKVVLDSCKAARRAGKWIEIATLVVPGRNDSVRELRSIASWIAKNLGRDTPWHIERFVPKYKMLDLPPTPVETLERARRTGIARGLKFVYISNLAPHPANHTYCPRCKKPVIKRLGFKVIANNMRGAKCPYCGETIPGVWS